MITTPREILDRNSLHSEGVLARPFGQVAGVVVPPGHAKFDVGVDKRRTQRLAEYRRAGEGAHASSRLSGSRGMPAGAAAGSYMSMSSRLLGSRWCSIPSRPPASRPARSKYGFA